MLQCATTLCARRGPCCPPPGPGGVGPVGGGGVAVCVASTSTFSGNATALSMYDLRSSTDPRDDANSGMPVVYSRVTSITAALSGPYVSTGKIATTVGLLDSITAR